MSPSKALAPIVFAEERSALREQDVSGKGGRPRFGRVREGDIDERRHALFPFLGQNREGLFADLGHLIRLRTHERRVTEGARADLLDVAEVDLSQGDALEGGIADAQHACGKFDLRERRVLEGAVRDLRQPFGKGHGRERSALGKGVFADRPDRLGNDDARELDTALEHGGRDGIKSAEADVGQVIAVGKCAPRPPEESESPKVTERMPAYLPDE